MASTSDDDAEGLMNTTRPPPPTPGSPEPSPPPPPVPTPPEPSPPPASWGEPPTEASSGSALDRYYASDRYIASTAHYHASIQFGVVPYPPLEEQPTLAVQMLVSLSSVSAMLFLSLLTWHALRKRPSRRCVPRRHTPLVQPEDRRSRRARSLARSRAPILTPRSQDWPDRERRSRAGGVGLGAGRGRPGVGRGSACAGRRREPTHAGPSGTA